MKNLKEKCISIIIASLTILTISGTIMAGTFTNSYSFKFHNHNPIIGNSGANTDFNSITGVWGDLRTLQVKVCIKMSDGTYTTYNTNSIPNTTNMTNIGLTVGRTSDSWSAVNSKHDVYLTDGSGYTSHSWIYTLIDSDFSGTTNFPM